MTDGTTGESPTGVLIVAIPLSTPDGTTGESPTGVLSGIATISALTKMNKN